ncbi:MAG: hypothetical protein CMJ34_01060 [Phycisphaerae bacterium]|nr:hypothetical protein [Phycisphaerae bacterium]
MSTSRGLTRASTIRIGVLLIILGGVGVFGWLRRPDLVREHLGIDAPAADTTQALQFARGGILRLVIELAEAEVVYLDRGGERLEAMIENEGFEDTITGEEILDDPDEFAARCMDTLKQADVDARRAFAIIEPERFRTDGDPNVLWTTLDLALQAERSIIDLGRSGMGDSLRKVGANDGIAAVIGNLKKIQLYAPPRAR